MFNVFGSNDFYFTNFTSPNMFSIAEDSDGGDNVDDDDDDLTSIVVNPVLAIILLLLIAILAAPTRPGDDHDHHHQFSDHHLSSVNQDDPYDKRNLHWHENSPSRSATHSP